MCAKHVYVNLLLTENTVGFWVPLNSGFYGSQTGVSCIKNVFTEYSGFLWIQRMLILIDNEDV